MTEPLPTVEELIGLMPHAVAMGITLDRAKAVGQTTQTQAVLQA